MPSPLTACCTKASKRSKAAGDDESTGKPEKEQLTEVFNKYETSGNGTIDCGEFVQAAQTLLPEISVELATEAFAVQDGEEIGRIDFAAFIRAYMKMKVWLCPNE